MYFLFLFIQATALYLYSCCEIKHLHGTVLPHYTLPSLSLTIFYVLAKHTVFQFLVLYDDDFLNMIITTDHFYQGTIYLYCPGFQTCTSFMATGKKEKSKYSINYWSKILIDPLVNSRTGNYIDQPISITIQRGNATRILATLLRGANFSHTI